MADISYSKNNILCALDTINIDAYNLPIRCDIKGSYKSISDLSTISTGNIINGYKFLKAKIDETNNTIELDSSSIAYSINDQLTLCADNEVHDDCLKILNIINRTTISVESLPDEITNMTAGSGYVYCKSKPTVGNINLDIDLGLNPNARLRSYISAISATLVDKIPAPTDLDLTCSGTNSDFIMAGTERFQGQSAKQEEELGGSGTPTYDNASDKVRKILDAVTDVFSVSLTSVPAPCSNVYYDKNENLYQCINAGIVHYKNENTVKDQIIYSRDILRDFNSFICELDKIKQINVQYFFLSTQLSSGISWQFSFDGCVFTTDGEYAGVEGKIVVNYGPYVKRANKSVNSCVYSSSSTLNQSTSTNTISIANLVKCTNLRSDLALFDFKNQDGINGSYEIFVDVKETGRSLHELVPLKYMLDILGPEKIISLRDILKLIDEIFVLWLNNMKKINYYVYICHYNCHGNVAFVDEAQSKCCFCGSCAWGLNAC